MKIGDRVLLCCMNNHSKYWAEGTIINFFPGCAIVDFVSFDGKTKGCTGVYLSDLKLKEDVRDEQTNTSY